MAKCPCDAYNDMRADRDRLLVRLDRIQKVLQRSTRMLTESRDTVETLQYSVYQSSLVVQRHQYALVVTLLAVALMVIFR
jgi:hypothetical protein